MGGTELCPWPWPWPSITNPPPSISNYFIFKVQLVCKFQSKGIACFPGALWPGAFFYRILCPASGCLNAVLKRACLNRACAPPAPSCSNTHVHAHVRVHTAVIGYGQGSPSHQVCSHACACALPWCYIMCLGPHLIRWSSFRQACRARASTSFADRVNLAASSRPRRNST